MSVQTVLKIENDGPVRIITMNRPRDFNAADAQMHRELASVWDEVALDASVGAVVLTGAGRAFSAGGDFPRMIATQNDPSIQDEVFGEARRTVLGMLNLPQPLVAAVNGPAVGLGASLVALSDLAVAADDAFLCDPHLEVGLVPADGAAFLWPLMAGLSRAKEFVFLGERISAASALEFGLINRVVPRDETLPVAVELAHRLAQVPRRAMQDTKRLMNQSAAQMVSTSLDYAIAAERQSVTSPEHVARVAALVDGSRKRAKG
ncbi:enoyl-CoA hydratase/isomerase family protein [Williamsia sp. DF01-3]|uniref:enoyl-CoA hydratase/isomerase family protein n=1 Tax=Williamsia sp. DF01-3 TaxID=2934157 RepID=UPI001FF2F2C6|nr:enoyl-CoA hydratase/isomerase family protein [Williamsia sp. DF01-3]MCK0517353.1 enoyl-CoA hydratase/isomerase family protein [Williamsia sp. DF01-3]